MQSSPLTDKNWNLNHFSDQPRFHNKGLLSRAISKPKVMRQLHCTNTILQPARNRQLLSHQCLKGRHLHSFHGPFCHKRPFGICELLQRALFPLHFVRRASPKGLATPRHWQWDPRSPSCIQRNESSNEKSAAGTALAAHIRGGCGYLL